MSRSQGSGNATIETVALSEKNGTAVANKECHDCNATLVTVSVRGNNTVILDSTTPTTVAPRPVTWNTVHRCNSTPKASGEEIDNYGRCWGWEDDRTCAFKKEDNTTMSCSRKQQVSGRDV